MTTYRIAAPDGKTYQIEGPPGASQDEVIQQVLAHHPAADTLKQESGTLATIGAGVAGGFGGTLLGAGEAATHYLGAEDTSKYLAGKRTQLQEFQQEHGGDTFTGKVANVVGSMAPALLTAPLTGGSSLAAEAMNIGLFAIPAFKDTYEARKQEGDSESLAVTQALREAGLAIVGGKIVGKGGSAVGKAISKGEAPGIAKQLAIASGEGAAFDVGSKATEKGVDAAFGKENTKPLLSEDTAVNAAAFGLLRVPHLRGKKATPVPEGEVDYSQAPERSPLADKLEAGLPAPEKRAALPAPEAPLAITAATEAITEPTLRPKKPAPEAYEVATPEEMVAEEARANAPETVAPTTGFTHEDLAAYGTSYGKAAQAWADKNLIGKTREDVQAMVAETPAIAEGKSHTAKLIREIVAPEAAKYDPTAERPVTEAETPAPQDAARLDRETVGAEPAVPVEPNRVEPAPSNEAVEPSRVAPAGESLRDADARAIHEPDTVKPEEPLHAAEALKAEQAETQRQEAPEPIEPVKPKLTAEEMLQRAEAAQRLADEAAKPTPTPTEPTKPVSRHEDILTKLQAIIDDHSAPKSLKQEASNAIDGMHDKDLMETSGDREAMHSWAERFIGSAKAKRFNAGEKDVDAVPLHEEAMAELRANNLVGALHHISQNATNEVHKALANRLKMLLSQTHVHLHNELKTDTGASARGAASADGNHIWLHTEHGMDMETLLHEATHAATERVIQSDYSKLLQPQRDAISELKQLWNAAKNDKAVNLSPEAHANLSEFVTEGMTNEALQKAMHAKPWKSATRWEAFKRSILKMIGVDDPKTMRDMHLAAMDTIFTRPDPAMKMEKRMFRVNTTTEQLVRGAGPLESEKKSMLGAAIHGFKNSDVPLGTRIRTEVADIAATIEHRLNTRFDGAVRDALGKLNPMGLYRQAQDYTKMLLTYLEKGALVKDTTTGLWRVEDVKEGKAPAKVYDLLRDWGTKHGYDFNESSAIASRVLEGVRLHGLRESNRTGKSTVALHKIDKTSNMSIDQQIDHMMQEYKQHPELAEISKVMDDARVAMIDHMVAVGRLSAQMGADWKSVAGYVPFDRISAFADNLPSVKRTGSKTPLGVGKLPELIGSDIHSVGNVFDNYMNTMGWMMGQVMNSDARLHTLQGLEDIGAAKHLGNNPRGKPNATFAFVDGEKMYWDLNSKYDAMAFKDLSAPKMKFVQFMGDFSRVLRATVTALPPFALKQVTDDIQRAIMTSGVKNPAALTASVLANFPKIAWAEVMGKGHPEMEGLGRLGITGGFDFLEGKPAASLLTDMGYKPRGFAAAALHRLEGITRASDFAVRKAVYEQTLKESNGDVLLAQTRARELINFRRRGHSEFIGTMVTTIPFFNAYIQGMDVALRAATGKGAASSIDRKQARDMFLTRAAIVTAFSAMYALGKSDDEDYKNADIRTRSNNWLLGNGLKLPVPGELGAIFKAVPEHVVEYFKRSGTPEEQTAMEATRSAMAVIFEQWAGRVTPISQAVKPLLEAFTNHSFLTGNQLEGTHQQSILASERYNDKTSEFAKSIAKYVADSTGIQVSPIIIDNFLSGYFGATAAMATMMSDKLINPDRVDRPLNKWALVSNYLLDPVGTRRLGEFYDAREKVNQTYGTFKQLAETDVDRAVKFAEEHQQELALHNAVNDTLQHLSETRKYKNFLSSHEGAVAIPDSAERARQVAEIRQIEVQTTEWLREVKVIVRKELAKPKTSTP